MLMSESRRCYRHVVRRETSQMVQNLLVAEEPVAGPNLSGRKGLCSYG